MNDLFSQVIRKKSALVLVDIQNDFCAGGSLSVPNAEDILPGIHKLMDADIFGTLAATQDWHPPNHVSFAALHQGRSPQEKIVHNGHDLPLWPRHCIQGSSGAALCSSLPWEKVHAIIRKGMDPTVDSYSGFRDNWTSSGRRPSTGLAGYLRDRGVKDVYVCGLARDVCVNWTARDAAEENFNSVLLWDLSRPVDRSSFNRQRSELTTHGVRVLSIETPVA
jgi:nicotinamidase/pyrazinamidase